MGKCEACQAGKCHQDYENRDRCQNVGACICTCQEHPNDTLTKGSCSFMGGAMLVVGGVTLTVFRGGAVATVGGAALTGAGTSMVMNPMCKKIRAERMTTKDYVTEIIVGVMCGMATAFVQVGTASLTGRTATETVALAAHVGADLASGAITTAWSEVVHIAENIEKVVEETCHDMYDNFHSPA